MPAPVAQLDRAPGYEPGGLEVRTLSGAMIFHAFPSGPFQTNAYVVACKKTKKAAIVDPSPKSFKKLVAYLEEHHLVPEKILLTHSHWDHIGDAALCQCELGIPIWVHELDRANLEQPGSDGLPMWVTIEPAVANHLLKDGEKFHIGDSEFVTIHTPGHTPGGVCFYSPSAKSLLSGDTLFQGSIGTLSLPTAQPDLMWPSLEKLANLPADTVVYPGHGSKTTIGEEDWLPRAKEIFG